MNREKIISWVGAALVGLLIALVVLMIAYCVYDSILVSGFDHHYCLSVHTGGHR